MKRENELRPQSLYPRSNPAPAHEVAALVGPLRERRRNREPIVKVWDRLVRVGHWMMVLFFAIIYLRYRKFPLHAYAGYLMLLIVIARIAWGILGSTSARFRAFWFSPAEVIGYARDAVRGHAAYYVSHNPLGAMMVYTLLTMMLVNGTLGIMLYSSGQQLGPLGALVSPDWEDLLKYAHKALGHLTAAFVATHIAGVLWAAQQHRENYVLAMITGFKRVPRNAGREQVQAYAVVPESVVHPVIRGLERWLNYRHPVIGSFLLVVALILVYLEITQSVTNLNKYLTAW